MLGGVGLWHRRTRPDPGAFAYDAQQRSRILRRLRQHAASLGFDLLNRHTGELLDPGPVVS